MIAALYTPHCDDCGQWWDSCIGDTFAEALKLCRKQGWKAGPSRRDPVVCPTCQAAKHG